MRIYKAHNPALLAGSSAALALVVHPVLARAQSGLVRTHETTELITAAFLVVAVFAAMVLGLWWAVKQTRATGAHPDG